MSVPTDASPAPVAASSVMASDLEELAISIREDHQCICESEKLSLLRASRAGAKLEKAFGQLPRGKRREWVRQKCGFSYRTAQLYLQIHLNPERAAKAQSIAHFVQLGGLNANSSSAPSRQKPKGKQKKKSDKPLLDDREYCADFEDRHPNLPELLPTVENQPEALRNLAKHYRGLDEVEAGQRRHEYLLEVAAKIPFVEGLCFAPDAKSAIRQYPAGHFRSLFLDGLTAMDAEFLPANVPANGYAIVFSTPLNHDLVGAIKKAKMNIREVVVASSKPESSLTPGDSHEIALICTTSESAVLSPLPDIIDDPYCLLPAVLREGEDRGFFWGGRPRDGAQATRENLLFAMSKYRHQRPHRHVYAASTEEDYLLAKRWLDTFREGPAGWNGRPSGAWLMREPANQLDLMGLVRATARRNRQRLLPFIGAEGQVR